MPHYQPNKIVLIVGGGIGGLSAALCLAKHNYQVEVFEQAVDFEEVGAGIQLSPNCVRVLYHLGLETELHQVVSKPESVVMRDWRSGKKLSSQLLGNEAVNHYGFPYFHIHRADLIHLLAKKAELDPLINLHKEASVTDFSQDGIQVEIKANNTIYAGDLLIGADGIHSLVRSKLHKFEAPRFTGHLAWRGLVNTHSLPEGLIDRSANVWLGKNKHFVHYPVKNGRLINCVGVVDQTEKSNHWQLESWLESGDKEEFQNDFADWHPTIQTLIHHLDSNSCFKWALYDRRPLTFWSKGRVTLLGDACHPTLPYMAQGAAMAIEDAAILGHCISQSNKAAETIEQALHQYEQLRRGRTRKIQLMSKLNARLYHLGKSTSWCRNLFLNYSSRSAMDWLYNYDPLSQKK